MMQTYDVRRWKIANTVRWIVVPAGDCIAVAAYRDRMSAERDCLERNAKRG